MSKYTEWKKKFSEEKNMLFRYYRLLDKKYANLIVRTKGKNQEYFDEEAGKWIETGIMLFYFWPESETFEMYEEITESEALKCLNNSNN